MIEFELERVGLEFKALSSSLLPYGWNGAKQVLFS